MNTTFKKTAAGQMLLTNVIGAYPDLYTPVPFKNDPKNTPRYGITILIPKTATAAVEGLQGEIAALAKEKHKIAKLPEADSCLQDGDSKSNEALHGHWVLSLYSYPSEKKQNNGAPGVLDRAKNPIAKDSAKAPYSGSIVNVIFDLYAPNNWKKVSGGLQAVQVVGDGPPIGRATDTSELPELPEDDDDGDV